MQGALIMRKDTLVVKTLNIEHNMHIAHAQYFSEGFENRLQLI